jgi:G protein-coupled receptor GPR1
MGRRQVVSVVAVLLLSLTLRPDYAVLSVAIHSAIQVFYPSTLVSSDGLYPYRRYVYAGAFAIPVLMAGLAFINPAYAYISQGGFCTLPIRPFWYRLALTWIPRYIIILSIIGLAIAIYAHVGFEFRAYSNVEQSLQSLKTSDGSTTPQENSQETQDTQNTQNTQDTQDDTKLEDITFELTTMQYRPRPERRKSSIGHDIFGSPRQMSSAPTLDYSATNVKHRVSFDSDTITSSFPGGSLHLTRPRTDARPILLAIPSDCSVAIPLSLSEKVFCKPSDESIPNPTPPPSESSPTREPSPSSPAQLRLAAQRRRIHRQLRLMFIYPLAYTLMWVIPFVMHCMNYWDKWANNPVEFVRVSSSICITLMGFVDALIFSLREKPWRGIEGTSGTFWGSFAMQGWKQAAVDEEARQVVERAHGASAASRHRGSASYRIGASGDFARIAAEQARARLDMEKEERLAALEFKQGGKLKHEGDDESNEEHDSLNIGDGGDGQVYDDNGLEDDTVG